MPFDELFESDREDCEEAGTSFRLHPPPCASPSSSHRPFLSYPLIKRTSRKDSGRSRRSHDSPRLTFTATAISWSDPRYPLPAGSFMYRNRAEPPSTLRSVGYQLNSGRTASRIGMLGKRPAYASGYLFRRLLDERAHSNNDLPPLSIAGNKLMRNRRLLSAPYPRLNIDDFPSAIRSSDIVFTSVSVQDILNEFFW